MGDPEGGLEGAAVTTNRLLYAIAAWAMTLPLLVPLFLVVAMLAWAAGTSTPFIYAFNAAVRIPGGLVWMRLAQDNLDEIVELDQERR